MIGAIVAASGFQAAFWTAALVAVAAFGLAFAVLPRSAIAEREGSPGIASR